jgi:glycine/D-amino acid oxidase-like deaminating enzyme
VVAAEELHRLEPSLGRDLVACRLGIGFPVAPGAATHAFAAVGSRNGVDIVLGDARPEIVAGRATGVHVDGRTEPAGVVLVAAGPSTSELLDPTGSWRPIQPVWGVVASLALDPAPRHALESADISIEPETPGDAGASPGRREASDVEVDFSLVPAADSSTLGSTFLPAEPEPNAWLPSLRRGGARYVPGIANAPLIGLRHCARPVSQDGRPLIGGIAGVAGLFVAAGHGPWGISTGPGSARLIADLILGRIDADAMPPALDPARFGPVQRQESGSRS